jgi:hypothetical protein
LSAWIYVYVAKEANFLRTFDQFLIMDYGVLRKLFVIEIVLLFAQFWMGMSSNLFINIPLNAPFDFFGYADGLEVLAHIVNGSLILFLGFTIIWYSYQTKNPMILKMSVLAVVFTIIAITSGVVFLKIFSVPSLYNSDNYFSIAMAMCFLSVFTVFFSEIYVTEKAQKPQAEEGT